MSFREEMVRYRPWVLRFWLLVLLAVLGFAGYLFLLGFSKDIPDVAELQNPRSFLATEIYAADGELIGSFFGRTGAMRFTKNCPSTSSTR
jgi:membrane carboxypeptidase/penicillin-binding protein